MRQYVARFARIAPRFAVHARLEVALRDYTPATARGTDQVIRQNQREGLIVDLHGKGDGFCHVPHLTAL